MKTVITHPNIALIKYWGKRDENLFLPTKSSLSVGLAALTTTTTIDLSSNGNDVVTINGEHPSPAHVKPILDFLAFFRTKWAAPPLTISTANSFPTAAGLASSASGFAALALGLDRFFNLGLSPEELSVLARRGSGSACRSVFGGFVIWHQGQRPDGQDSYAEQLYSATHWPEFCIIIVVVNAAQKGMSSRQAMQRSVATSPIYNQWLIESEHRLAIMHQALAVKDFDVVGQCAEADCLGMHATIHTSQPPMDFWSPTTRLLMQAVIDMRNNHGIKCYFTIDAGPNVKILCLEKDTPQILHHLAAINGVTQCIISGIAATAQI